MKVLHVGLGSLLTGGDLADAVLEYAAALARQQASEVIEIPFLDRDGEAQLARILVGPHTQIWAASTPFEGVELVDSARTRIFLAKATGIGAARPLLEPNVALAFDPYDL